MSRAQQVHLTLSTVVAIPDAARKQLHGRAYRLHEGDIGQAQPQPSGCFGCAGPVNAEAWGPVTIQLRDQWGVRHTKVKVTPASNGSCFSKGTDSLQLTSPSLPGDLNTVEVTLPAPFPPRSWLLDCKLRPNAWTQPHRTANEGGYAGWCAGPSGPCVLWSDEDPGILLLHWAAFKPSERPSHGQSDTPQWVIITLSEGLDSATTAPLQRAPSGSQKPPLAPRLSKENGPRKPVVVEAQVVEHAAGSKVAISVSDAAGHLCVILLDATAKVLMNTTLSSYSTAGSIRRSVRSLVWLPHTTVLVIVDSLGGISAVDVAQGRAGQIGLVVPHPGLKSGTGQPTPEVSFQHLLRIGRTRRQHNGHPAAQCAFSLCALHPTDPPPSSAVAAHSPIWLAVTDGHSLALLRCRPPLAAGRTSADTSQTSQRTSASAVRSGPLRERPSGTGVDRSMGYGGVSVGVGGEGNSPRGSGHESPSVARAAVGGAAVSMSSQGSWREGRRPVLQVQVPDRSTSASNLALGPTSQGSATAGGSITSPASAGGLPTHGHGQQQGAGAATPLPHAVAASNAMALALPNLAPGSSLRLLLQTGPGRGNSEAVGRLQTEQDCVAALGSNLIIDWKQGGPSLPNAPSDILQAPLPRLQTTKSGPPNSIKLGALPTTAATTPQTTTSTNQPSPTDLALGVTPLPLDIYCLPPEVVQSLQFGDSSFLQGDLLASLAYYTRAHVYGFLPSYLVLQRMSCLAAAHDLLHAFCIFLCDHPSPSPSPGSSPPLGTHHLHTRWLQASTSILSRHIDGITSLLMDSLPQELHTFVATTTKPIPTTITTNGTDPIPTGPDGTMRDDTMRDGTTVWMMQAAWHQLGLACQCAAYLSCTLHGLTRMSSTSAPPYGSRWHTATGATGGGAGGGGLGHGRTGGSGNYSSRGGALSSPTLTVKQPTMADGRRRRLPACCIGLPAPTIWHPLSAPTTTTTTTTSATTHHSKPASTVPGIPCRLQLFHTAFDVSILLGAAWLACVANTRPMSNITPLGTSLSASTSLAQLVRRASIRLGHRQTSSLSPAAAASAVNGAVRHSHSRTVGMGGGLASGSPGQPVLLPAVDHLRQPAFAAGLLLMAHACEVHVQTTVVSLARGGFWPPAWLGEAAATIPRKAQGGAQAGIGHIHWQLLGSYPSAGWAAAVWRAAGDWRKAAVTALSTHQALRQQSLEVRRLAMGQVTLHALVAAAVNAAASDASSYPLGTPGPFPDGALTGTRGSVPYPNTSLSLPYLNLPMGGGSKGWVAGMGLGGATGGAPVPAVLRGPCLDLGWDILVQQLGPSLTSHEVSGVCDAMHELVNVPRAALGMESDVYLNLLSEVSNQLLEMMPKRMCIMPLLPSPTSHAAGLLALSPATIHRQLQAHLGCAMAHEYLEARMAHGCKSMSCTPAEQVIRAILSAPEPEGCLKLLLKWQGVYDVQRMTSALNEVCEFVEEYQLVDDADWSLDSFLPMLDTALSITDLMPLPDKDPVLLQLAQYVAQQTDPSSGPIPLRTTTTTTGLSSTATTTGLAVTAIRPAAPGAAATGGSVLSRTLGRPANTAAPGAKEPREGLERTNTSHAFQAQASALAVRLSTDPLGLAAAAVTGAGVADDPQRGLDGTGASTDGGLLTHASTGTGAGLLLSVLAGTLPAAPMAVADPDMGRTRPHVSAPLSDSPLRPLHDGELVDLNDLSMLVDMSQLMGTLLQCIRPHAAAAVAALLPDPRVLGRGTADVAGLLKSILDFGSARLSESHGGATGHLPMPSESTTEDKGGQGQPVRLLTVVSELNPHEDTPADDQDNDNGDDHDGHDRGDKRRSLSSPQNILPTVSPSDLDGNHNGDDGQTVGTEEAPLEGALQRARSVDYTHRTITDITSTDPPYPTSGTLRPFQAVQGTFSGGSSRLGTTGGGVGGADVIGRPSMDHRSSLGRAQVAAVTLQASICSQLQQLLALDWVVMCRTHMTTLLAWLRAEGNAVAGGMRADVMSMGGGDAVHEEGGRGARRACAEDLILQWTVALLTASKIYSDVELQGTVHAVMCAVQGVPPEGLRGASVQALERALHQRSIFNSKLAEQLKRLKGLVVDAAVEEADEAVGGKQTAGRVGNDVLANASMYLGPGVEVHDPAAARKMLMSATLTALKAYAVGTTSKPEAGGNGVSNGTSAAVRVSAAAGVYMDSAGVRVSVDRVTSPFAEHLHGHHAGGEREVKEEGQDGWEEDLGRTPSLVQCTIHMVNRRPGGFHHASSSEHTRVDLARCFIVPLTPAPDARGTAPPPNGLARLGSDGLLLPLGRSVGNLAGPDTGRGSVPVLPVSPDAAHATSYGVSAPRLSGAVQQGGSGRRSLVLPASPSAGGGVHSRSGSFTGAVASRLSGAGNAPHLSAAAGTGTGEAQPSRLSGLDAAVRGQGLQGRVGPASGPMVLSSRLAPDAGRAAGGADVSTLSGLARDPLGALQALLDVNSWPRLLQAAEQVAAETAVSAGAAATDVAPEQQVLVQCTSAPSGPAPSLSMPLPSQSPPQIHDDDGDDDGDAEVDADLDQLVVVDHETLTDPTAVGIPSDPSLDVPSEAPTHVPQESAVHAPADHAVESVGPRAAAATALGVAAVGGAAVKVVDHHEDVTDDLGDDQLPPDQDSVVALDADIQHAVADMHVPLEGLSEEHAPVALAHDHSLRVVGQEVVEGDAVSDGMAKDDDGMEGHIPDHSTETAPDEDADEQYMRVADSAQYAQGVDSGQYMREVDVEQYMQDDTEQYMQELDADDQRGGTAGPAITAPQMVAVGGVGDITWHPHAADLHVDPDREEDVRTSAVYDRPSLSSTAVSFRFRGLPDQPEQSFQGIPFTSSPTRANSSAPMSDASTATTPTPVHTGTAGNTNTGAVVNTGAVIDKGVDVQAVKKPSRRPALPALPPDMSQDLEAYLFIPGNVSDEIVSQLTGNLMPAGNVSADVSVTGDAVARSAPTTAAVASGTASASDSNVQAVTAMGGAVYAGGLNVGRTRPAPVQVEPAASMGTQVMEVRAAGVEPRRVVGGAQEQELTLLDLLAPVPSSTDTTPGRSGGGFESEDSLSPTRAAQYLVLGADSPASPSGRPGVSPRAAGSPGAARAEQSPRPTWGSASPTSHTNVSPPSAAVHAHRAVGSVPPHPPSALAGSLASSPCAPEHPSPPVSSTSFSQLSGPLPSPRYPSGTPLSSTRVPHPYPYPHPDSTNSLHLSDFLRTPNQGTLTISSGPPSSPNYYYHDPPTAPTTAGLSNTGRHRHRRSSSFTHSSLCASPSQSASMSMFYMNAVALGDESAGSDGAGRGPGSQASSGANFSPRHNAHMQATSGTGDVPYSLGTTTQPPTATVLAAPSGLSRLKDLSSNDWTSWVMDPDAATTVDGTGVGTRGEVSGAGTADNAGASGVPMGTRHAWPVASSPRGRDEKAGPSRLSPNAQAKAEGGGSSARGHAAGGGGGVCVQPRSDMTGRQRAMGTTAAAAAGSSQMRNVGVSGRAGVGRGGGGVGSGQVQMREMVGPSSPGAAQRSLAGAGRSKSMKALAVDRTVVDVGQDPRERRSGGTLLGRAAAAAVRQVGSIGMRVGGDALHVDRQRRSGGVGVRNGGQSSGVGVGASGGRGGERRGGAVARAVSPAVGRNPLFDVGSTGPQSPAGVRPRRD